MRFVLMGLATAVAVLASDPSHAQVRRSWCSEGHIGFGTLDCSFSTLEQCRASASGTGRHCTPNPAMARRPVDGRQSPRRSDY